MVFLFLDAVYARESRWLFCDRSHRPPPSTAPLLTPVRVVAAGLGKLVVRLGLVVLLLVIASVLIVFLLWFPLSFLLFFMADLMRLLCPLLADSSVFVAPALPHGDFLLLSCSADKSLMRLRPPPPPSQPSPAAADPVRIPPAVCLAASYKLCSIEKGITSRCTPSVCCYAEVGETGMNQNLYIQ